MIIIEEVWKTIPFAKDYKISNYGRVLSNRYRSKNRILKQKITKCGYNEIHLMTNEDELKDFLVHRLVMMVFNPIENMENFEVNHKDENKQNNYIDNLEWCSSKENTNYGTRNQRLSEKQSVRVLCVETGIIYNSFREASELTNIDKGSINMCCTGYRNRKTAGGYHWRYYE